MVSKYIPDLVVIETIVEYENTYRELTYSYEHWYKRKYKRSIQFQSYKPHGGEGKKRDRIRTGLATPYENNLMYHTGRVVVTREENGKWKKTEIPMPELYDQLVNLPITEKLDVVDAENTAVRFRQFPEPISEEEFIESAWQADQEEYEDDFIVNAHEAML